VPAATIQRGSQGTFVYVVTNNLVTQLRPVTLQVTEGNDVAIASGLKAGEMVLIEGMDKVQDGTRVDVQSRPGGQSGPSGSSGSSDQGAAR